jgi:hypothetical protein
MDHATLLNEEMEVPSSIGFGHSAVTDMNFEYDWANLY